MITYPITESVKTEMRDNISHHRKRFISELSVIVNLLRVGKGNNAIVERVKNRRGKRDNNDIVNLSNARLT